LKLVFGICRQWVCLSRGDFESEVITKVEAAFVQDSFCLSLPAIIIDAALIKDAVQAAVKIGLAETTLFLSADKLIGGNFFLAMMTNLHGCKNTGNAEFLSSDFQKLCSCH
jgi:hypothetical protein